MPKQLAFDYPELEYTPEELEELQRDEVIMSVVREVNGPTGQQDFEALMQQLGARAVPDVLAAIQKGSLYRLKKALRSGANVNETDDSGDLALHLATQQGNLAAVKLLMLCGANPYLVNQAGQTALDLATSHEMREALLLIHK